MSTSRLEAAELLVAAERETALTDWGDPTLPDRFRSRSI